MTRRREHRLPRLRRAAVSARRVAARRRAAARAPSGSIAALPGQDAVGRRADRQALGRQRAARRAGARARVTTPGADRRKPLLRARLRGRGRDPPRILEARNAGTAVLLVSADLDEIFALSDRILVMSEGRIVHERRRRGWPTARRSAITWVERRTKRAPSRVPRAIATSSRVNFPRTILQLDPDALDGAPDTSRSAPASTSCTCIGMTPPAARARSSSICPEQRYPNTNTRASSTSMKGASRSDESGNHPKGAFVINPPGTAHRVWSREGCLVLHGGAKAGVVHRAASTG